jgi:glycerophosphoryl diester phosphodiesterase
MNSHSLKLIIVIALIQLHLEAYSQSKLLLYEPFNYPAESTLSGRGLNGLRKTLSMSPDKILVCAHRGVHRTTNNNNYAAENSMTSIKEAIAKNVDIVEIDVRTSSDGVLVLMHDATLTRTTNGSGNVKDRTYSYLRALKLKIYGINTLTSDTIPTLEQVLREFKDKMFFNLDIKDANLADVYSLIQSTGMTDNVMVFVREQADAANLLSKGVIPLPTCYNNSTFDSYMQNNVRPIIFHSDNDGHYEEWISMKTAGIKIFTNIYILDDIKPTSNNWSLLNEAIRNGVNVVQTDYPIEMLNYLKTK